MTNLNLPATPWQLGKTKGHVYDANGFLVVDTSSEPYCSSSYYERAGDGEHWGERPAEYYTEREEDVIEATARLLRVAPEMLLLLQNIAHPKRGSVEEKWTLGEIAEQAHNLLSQ